MKTHGVDAVLRVKPRTGFSKLLFRSATAVTNVQTPKLDWFTVVVKIVGPANNSSMFACGSFQPIAPGYLVGFFVIFAGFEWKPVL